MSIMRAYKYVNCAVLACPCAGASSGGVSAFAVGATAACGSDAPTGSGCGGPSTRRAGKPGGGTSGRAACRRAGWAPCALSAWTRFASCSWVGLRPRVRRFCGVGVRCRGGFRVDACRVDVCRDDDCRAGGCRHSSSPLMSSYSSEHILPTMTIRHARASTQPASSASARRSESSASAILRPVGTPSSRSRRQARSPTWHGIAMRLYSVPRLADRKRECFVEFVGTPGRAV